MLRYILNRLALAAPTLLGVSIITFALLQLIPGDPVRLMLGTDATPENVAELRRDLGLDDPLPVQYVNWVGGALHGDLGRSIVTNQSVSDLLWDRFKATGLLTLTALVISSVLGILAGVIAALRPYQLPDKISMLIALVGVSMPSFWLGILLIFLFSVKLGLLPSSGMGPPSGSTLQDLPKYLVLPAITLAMRSIGIVARMTRASMLEVLSQDYIRTANAKGLAARVVVMRHALRNVLVPIVTVIGLQMGTLLGGAVLVETVFSWPGLGTLIVGAIINRDFPVIQGGLLLVALIFVLVNLLVDLSYGLIDPRVRYS